MEAASQVEVVKHLRTAQRHAASVLPPAVRNLSELHQEITARDIEDVTRTRDGHRLLSFYLPVHGSLLLTTRRQLDLMESASMIHVDATYKVVRRRMGCQLFTIHANWGGHVSIRCNIKLPPITTNSIKEHR